MSALVLICFCLFIYSIYLGYDCLVLSLAKCRMCSDSNQLVYYGRAKYSLGLSSIICYLKLSYGGMTYL